MRKITILHVFKDQKFFDYISNIYDGINFLNNLYYFYTSNKKYSYKYIKRTEKVKLVHNLSEYKKLFSSNDIDVILFHSMSEQYHSFFDYIDDSKIVIWWSWGGDIYNRNYGVLPPLIKYELYKPLTKEYIKNAPEKRAFRYKAKLFVKKLMFLYLLKKRNKAIRRTDYFIPCMPLDYKLLKENCSFFYAKELPIGMTKPLNDLIIHETPGNILIGNSLTYTNNHLDIFEELKNIRLGYDRKYIIPVSYGWGGAFDCNPENLISKCKLEEKYVIWLKDYLDRDEYFRLFNNVTHAIYGVLRQQALGNIYSCLRKGIKVYLYKDSIISRQLKDQGFIFYTIEDDLNERSLSECLSKDDALTNLKADRLRYEMLKVENLEMEFKEMFKERFQ